MPRVLKRNIQSAAEPSAKIKTGAIASSMVALAAEGSGEDRKRRNYPLHAQGAIMSSARDGRAKVALSCRWKWSMDSVFWRPAAARLFA
jgi:hypothetical protein